MSFTGKPARAGIAFQHFPLLASLVLCEFYNQSIPDIILVMQKHYKGDQAHIPKPLDASCMITSISLDSIKKNSFAGAVFIEHLHYVIIHDIISCICNKTRNESAEVYRRLDTDCKQELAPFIRVFHFTGKVMNNVCSSALPFCHDQYFVCRTRSFSNTGHFL